jgi:hypothetical protein
MREVHMSEDPAAKQKTNNATIVMIGEQPSPSIR